jgi:uncharacterized protein (DUF2336 family)
LIHDPPSDLLILARSPQPADRERLLMGVVDLCEQSMSTAGEVVGEAKTLIDQVFMALVVEAEREVRRRLAERISTATWAPRALIHILALDDIEIARPIIASSPLLDDADLIRLLIEATLEHQIEVARRPGISAAVVEALLERRQPAALAALAANDTARLPSDGLARLVEAARKLPALRAPLSRHPQLTADLAGQLYAWVGEALRDALVGRFKLDRAALDLAMQETVQEVHAEPFGRPIVPQRTEDQEAMERRLVEKLDAAGQLKPGYLMRALREDKLSLFEAGLARLGGLQPAQLRRALSVDRPEVLALACVAAGIDRSVFRTVLGRVRELNKGQPGGGGEGETRAAAVFQGVSAQEASLAFGRIATLI